MPIGKEAAFQASRALHAFQQRQEALFSQIAAITREVDSLKKLGTPMNDIQQYFLAHVAPALDEYSAASTLFTRSQLSLFANQVNLAIRVTVQQLGKGIGPSQALQSSILSNLPNFLRMSALAECSLSRFPLPQVASAAMLTEKLISPLRSLHGDLLIAYTGLLHTISQTTLSMARPPSLVDAASESFFLHSDLMENLSVEELDEDLENEKEVARADITERHEIELRGLLNDIDPKLLRMLDGAKATMDPSNPDHVRHFSISLRELFTHVTHTLAPDQEVMSWTTDPSFFKNGRPTRRARILYICRNLEEKALSKFVVKDVPATLALLDVYQQGTHKLDPSSLERLLPVLELRMKALLYELLTITLLPEDKEEPRA